ncbi:MAG: nicotinate (nicotinamide) nucleotide adenylyltransferase [Candidatus Omnitrophica bacterium]|nr:nicotinate (nicotinamide) nucleotide adenylyltransferase [Candidatus Omnitrophota bacterium]
MRIGVFGGSFNPVHRGHLELARAAAAELGLDKLFFVPSRQTPLKSGRGLLPVRLRVELLRRSLRKEPRFFLSLCETRRKGASFTVDTLKYFKKKFGKKTVLYFLAGADTLKNLSRWKSLPEVLRLCRFVVCSRPDVRVGRVPLGVIYQPFGALEISASDIRRRLAAGKSVRGLVPPGTERLLRNYFRSKVTHRTV